MQGTAVQTEVVDRGRIAREIIFGRQLMQKILEIGGWLENNPTPLEQEFIMEGIKANTTVSNVGQNLVRISYKNQDPEKAYIVTKGFADLFIEGSLNKKIMESKAAFEFIDMQVKQYEQKLKNSEEALKKFREENVDFRSGAEVEVRQRITRFRTQIEELEQQLREAKITKVSLQQQLSGESEAAAGLSRAEQLRSRIAELQSNLDNLRLSYHETYPDIIKIKHQIRELRTAMVNAEKRRERSKREAEEKGILFIDESIRANPIYQQLQSDLYETNTLIATLNGRLEETRKLLQQELERNIRISAAEAELTSLTRDYNVNNDIYQDLLRRRENARVSMNLDTEHRGLSLSISEPAYLPLSPSGPRYIHFVLIGIALGIALPVGFFYLLKLYVPRICEASDVEEVYEIDVIGQFTHYYSPMERIAKRNERYVLFAITALTFVMIFTVSAYRLLGGQ